MSVDPRIIDRLIQRIERLESQTQFVDSADWMPGNWWGRISPTQPASRIIQLHAGFLWYDGYFRYLSDTVYDFSDVGVFTASGYFRWTVLRADVTAATITFNLYESGEFGTADEAENDFWVNGPSVDLIGTNYYPLCVVIVQNDGDTITPGSIENITLADTDQSYLFIRDFRPWHWLNP